jgi:subtilisin family serine protease
MNRRSRATVFFVVGLLIATAASTVSARQGGSPGERGDDSGLSDGFQPAVVRAQQGLGRYFVVMDQPAVAQEMRAQGELTGSAQRGVAAAARDSQAAAIGDAQSLGGKVIFRYDTLVNGFSANLSPSAAGALADRSDVKSVQPVSIVRKLNETSVPFIGATDIWDDLDAQGEGITVAVVDTGIDYTHANYGGPGTVEAFESNDPNIVEPGTFPTSKVIGGFDLVGSNYDVVDDALGGNNEDPTNDIPHPDPDPLDDDDGHGSHTSGTVAGIGVPGEIGPGVAPKAKLLAVKVWDEGNSTDDVLVAGYERAMDPNDDGSTADAADVLSFSGGVDYGTQNSVEARAAQQVVNMGTVFVASAGNSGNQPVAGSAYITGTPANAPGVISVAASIDEFNAQNLTVDNPPTTLPDGGLMVNQEWSPALDSDLTGDIVDAREFDEPADPANPTATDRMLCDPIGGTPFAGKIALIFKASSGAGDCFADDKVVNAQNAGADAVVLWNGFGGLPSQIGIGGDGSNITVPVVMISTNDSETLGDTVSPDAASSSFNTVATTVTLHADEATFPQFTDAMTDFTSEGPARGTSALKPDITAPGFDIQSTANGTGDEGVKLSGTSMAAPHISGVAALLRQLHPDWSPGRIKAVLMNQATQELNDNNLDSPVSATVMGAGRVQAFESATAVSVAQPGSLSYGLDFASGPTTEVQSFVVTNTGKKAKRKKGKGKKARKKAKRKNKKRTHDYAVSGGDPRYSDFDPSVASVDVSIDGGGFSDQASFTLKPQQSKQVSVRLNLDPSAITEADQENGWYYFHPNVDGNVTIEQSKHGNDSIHVPWHVAPLAASDNSLSESSLDISGGPDSMELVEGPAAGTSYADLYELGAIDGDNSKGEEDVVAIGARSFTGNDVEDDTTQGVPDGTDAFGEIGWLDFLADPDSPAEPVEFGVQTYGVHNVTETLEVDVLVDTGADGIYEGDDEDIPADYLIAKLAAPDSTSGEVCVFDLSLADPFDECAATYFADYSNYNSNLVGLVVSAGDIGLTNSDSTLAYQVEACTGTFSGDIPGFLCDSAGETDENDIYTARLNAADPALDIDPLVCQGFWGGDACDSGDPIEVDVGSAQPGDDPSILARFPNNAPSHDPTVVTTDTGDAP